MNLVHSFNSIYYCSPDVTEIPRTRRRANKAADVTTPPDEDKGMPDDGEINFAAVLEKLSDQIGMISERRKLRPKIDEQYRGTKEYYRDLELLDLQNLSKKLCFIVC